MAQQDLEAMLEVGGFDPQLLPLESEDDEEYGEAGADDMLIDGQ